MPTRDLNAAAITAYSSLPAHSVGQIALDSIQETKETRYINERFSKDWTYFNRIPKLKSAILMKAVWTVGKGYETDVRTKVILDHVIGNGKQTFLDILFNMIVMKQVGRDSFAEIIRDEETKSLLNLKILNPGTMAIIYGKDGMIKRYEQINGKEIITFKPEEILHFSHNNFGGEMHGRSVPEQLEKIILTDDKLRIILDKLTQFQAVPFIIFKVKSDNATTINTFKTNIKEAREKGEDLIIPDDENLLSWETVVVSPSALIMEWYNSNNAEFYRASGMPLILFGTAGSTESGGKIEYLGHETVFEHDQLEIEKQIEAQLGLVINLNSPTSLLESLRTDENKDAQNALAMQQSDMMAGRGK